MVLVVCIVQFKGTIGVWFNPNSKKLHTIHEKIPSHMQRCSVVLKLQSQTGPEGNVSNRDTSLLPHLSSCANRFPNLRLHVTGKQDMKSTDAIEARRCLGTHMWKHTFIFGPTEHTNSGIKSWKTLKNELPSPGCILRGGTPWSNEISAKMWKVVPLKYALAHPQRGGR